MALERIDGGTLTFLYSPPDFAKRCNIKIDYNKFECTIVIKNMNENDAGQWGLYLESGPLESDYLFELREPVMLVLSGADPEDELWHGCTSPANFSKLTLN